MIKMMQFVLLLLFSISRSIIPELEELEGLLEVSDGIGWIKGIGCIESEGSFSYPSPFNNISRFVSFAKYAISIKFVPTNITNTTLASDYQVETEICSNPVFNLNNGKDLSTTSDIETGLAIGLGNLDDWIGTSIAKRRLTNLCVANPGLGKELNPLEKSIYHACGNGEYGIRISLDYAAIPLCEWKNSDIVGHNIDIYLGFDPDLSIHCNYKNENTITITACDGWNKASYSNSLQFQVYGTRGSTAIFPINEYSVLPINGNSLTFDIQHYELTSARNALVFGEIYGITLIMDDPNGYCIKELTLNTHFATESFGAEYFGNGIILNQKCDRSFIYISDNLPLIPCIDESPFKLTKYALRGIHNVSIRSCNVEDAGIALRDMTDSLYAVITGTESFSTSYSSTEIVYLDHYVPAGVNVDYLGELVLSNVLLSGVLLYTDDVGKTRAGANAECIGDNGVGLATILSPSMQRYAETLCTTDCWIGLSGSDSLWQWEEELEDTVPVYYHWYPGYPLDDDTAICTALSNQDNRGWYNKPCSDTLEQWLCNDPMGYFHEFYSDVEGFLSAIKIESVNYADYPLNTSDFADFKLVSSNIGVEETFYESMSFVFNDGRYIIIGLDGSPYIAKETLITISIGYNILRSALNIYFIFKDKPYSLSFILESVEGSITWFEANEECLANHGTSLGSIHSEQEFFLMKLINEPFVPFWIGLNDRKSEGTFSWIDGSVMDYINWSPGQPDDFGDIGEGCVQIWDVMGGSMNDLACTSDLVSSYICGSPYWPPNTARTFQFNTDVDITDVIVLTIGNNGDDSMCIDGVAINDEYASYISNNWIGSPTSILSAVFRYPVCASEVVDVSFDIEEATVGISEASIAGASCANHNRFISTTCSVSQSYETTTTTSFTFSSSSGESTEYSWGKSSAVTIGWSEEESHTDTTTTSDTFTWGLEEEKTISIPFVSKVKITAKQEWTDTTEKSKSDTKSSSRSRDTTTGSSSGGSKVTESSTTQDQTYEHSETFSVECTAESDVPASHSIDYSLTFTTANMTITTYTDIKLTLCSAFVHPDRPNDPSNYIYLDNIPGYLTQTETTSCSVDFSAAESLRNDISCAEEQKLAISTGATYVPLCLETDTDLYDGCQCEIIDSWTLAVCYCVDPKGNMIDGKTMAVEDTTWQSVCVDSLRCDNSNVSIPDVTIPISLASKISNPVLISDGVSIHKTKEITKNGAFLEELRPYLQFIFNISVLGLLCIILVLLCKYRNNDNSYIKMDQMEEFEEMDSSV